MHIYTYQCIYTNTHTHIHIPEIKRRASRKAIYFKEQPIKLEEGLEGHERASDAHPKPLGVMMFDTYLVHHT